MAGQAGLSRLPTGSGTLLPIIPLSEPISASMRAHLAFPSLSSLTLTLVHNALDAGAKAITVTLDFATWSLECVDDGRGFPVEVFDGRQHEDACSEGSKTATMRRTNQHHGRSLWYGWKGASLGMMAHLGRLRISSIPENTPERAYVLIQKGDTRTFSGPDPSPDAKNYHHGSKVTLTDLFSGLPVRRRSLDTGSKRRLEVERVKRIVTVASLREPQVTFSLRVRTDGSDEGDWSTLALKQGLRLNKVTSLRARLLDAYSQHPLRSEDLVEIHSSVSDSCPIAVRGLISLAPVYTKEIQHIFLNKHPLITGSSFAEHTSGKNGGYETPRTFPSQQTSGSPTRSAAAHTHFGDADADLFAAVSSIFHSSIHFKQSTDRSLSLDSKRAIEGPARRSPTKTKGAHPAFLLDVTLRQKDDLDAAPTHNTLKRNRTSIKKVLQAAVADSLRRNGLLLAMPSDETSQPTLQRVLSRSASMDTADNHATSLVSTRSPRKRRRVSPELPITVLNNTSEQHIPLDFIEHTHEVTGRKYLIDPRTGNSYEAGDPVFREGGSRHNDIKEGVNDILRRSRSGGTFERGFGSAEVASSDLLLSKGSHVEATTTAEGATSRSDPAPAWLRSTVAGWKNPILPLPVEEEIPSLGFSAASGTPAAPPPHSSSLASIRRREASMLLPAIQAHSRFFQESSESSSPTLKGCSHSAEDDEDEHRLSEIEATLDKDALRGARVLGQVDRKFVLCVVQLPRTAGQRLPSNNALLLIDQHAADERVRVERLLQEYVQGCRSGKPDCHPLREPTEVELSTGEIEALEKNDVLQRCLQRGGFVLSFRRVETDQDSPGTPFVKLFITSIPSVIKDRLLAERGLLTALIRDFGISTSDERGPSLLSHFGEPSSGQACEESSYSWIGILRTLPRLMLDLIYSRACRGAIMFNDILTQAQCERLVDDVAETAFPFQCAHGRFRVDRNQFTRTVCIGNLFSEQMKADSYGQQALSVIRDDVLNSLGTAAGLS
ncbi:unnamed protein product [Tilletia laevis]|uniref:MutL C-terminal dimerisation domain-containing protein n=1 Tax=Tilletia laevis TaxID=157183 RepID=A0A9N8MD39_9BASI|nr:unnamed protein product [Tilletia laevis]